MGREFNHIGTEIPTMASSLRVRNMDSASTHMRMEPTSRASLCTKCESFAFEQRPRRAFGTCTNR